jgi:hypothetical protein
MFHLVVLELVVFQCVHAYARRRLTTSVYTSKETSSCFATLALSYFSPPPPISDLLIYLFVFKAVFVRPGQPLLYVMMCDTVYLLYMKCFHVA